MQQPSTSLQQQPQKPPPKQSPKSAVAAPVNLFDDDDTSLRSIFSSGDNNNKTTTSTSSSTTKQAVRKKPSPSSTLTSSSSQITVDSNKQTKQPTTITKPRPLPSSPLLSQTAGTNNVAPPSPSSSSSSSTTTATRTTSKRPVQPHASSQQMKATTITSSSSAISSPESKETPHTKPNTITSSSSPSPRSMIEHALTTTNENEQKQPKQQKSQRKQQQNHRTQLQKQQNHLQLHLDQLVQLAKDHFELDYCSTPLGKQVVTILGDQSSGKSSLINHLFGCNVRVTGEHAVDSQFTIIESVPESEFIEMLQSFSSASTASAEEEEIRLSMDRKAKELEDRMGPNWLHRPVQRLETDPRKGLVWLELKQLSKVRRYRQFFESHMKSIFLKYDSLVKCIIVNERFVSGSELSKLKRNSNNNDEKIMKKEKQILEDWDMLGYQSNGRPTVCNLIMIDSPGFNDESVLDVEKFRANIDLLEFFYRQSSLVLFMASPTHILSMGNALHMLQLTVLDQNTRNRMFNQVHQQMASTINSSSNTNKSSMLTSIISSCYSALETRVSSMISSAGNLTEDYFGGGSGLASSAQDTSSYKYFGASIYDKLYFVINKADICRNPHYVYYEFGTALGRRFKHLPIPPASHILLIGVPMEQRTHRIALWNVEQKITEDVTKTMPIETIPVGQLMELEYILDMLKEDKHVQTNLINHIQYVFEKVQEVYNGMSYYRQFVTQKHFQQAKSICDNCCLSGD